MTDRLCKVCYPADGPADPWTSDNLSPMTATDHLEMADLFAELAGRPVRVDAHDISEAEARVLDGNR